MIGQTNQKILSNRFQRALRCTMTDAERVLWQLLRGRQVAGVKFRRQHPFADYVLDFVCLENGLVVEVDGGQHGHQKEYDEQRTATLQAAGFHVLRFWNNEVLQESEAVIEKIWLTVMELGDTTAPSPSRPPP